MITMIVARCDNDGDYTKMDKVINVDMNELNEENCVEMIVDHDVLTVCLEKNQIKDIVDELICTLCIVGDMAFWLDPETSNAYTFILS